MCEKVFLNRNFIILQFINFESFYINNCPALKRTLHNVDCFVVFKELLFQECVVWM